MNAGDELVFQGNANPKSPYWIGALAACPLGNPSCGGMDFPKKEKNKAGKIHMLSTADLEKLKLDLPTRIFRFTGKPSNANDGSGSADYIQVPTPADGFEFTPTDRGLAEFIYCVPAPNGRGKQLPEPLSVTGLEVK